MTIRLSGAAIVLPERVLDPGTITLEGGRIVEIADGATSSADALDVRGHVVVPGFVDVHVHGLKGRDVLDGGGALAALAADLPACGVTAFCPTSIACSPDVLRAFLDEVRACRLVPASASARVIGAHLESNFISPDYNGAQPVTCLRMPPRPGATPTAAPGEYDGAAILQEIERAPGDVAIVTLAPELEDALPLVRHLVACGIRVSLGHSGATFEIAMAAIDAGARHATHLFNRMPPLDNRAPGLAGAVLAHDAVAAEIIGDLYHVHPAMVRMAVAAKGRHRMMAITDATAGAGLAVGSRTRLGDRIITVRETAAFLDDGTLAGSVLTMDEAFRRLVRDMGFSLVDAVHLCATTPSRELGLVNGGVLTAGATADLVVLDGSLAVRQTFIGGVPAFRRP